MSPDGERPGAVERRSAARRYSAFVGLAFLALIILATLNTIHTASQATLDPGSALPEFAVPDAANGPLDADANVFQDDCATSEIPCPADQRRPSACRITVPGAIRVCDLFNRPLVISFWFMRFANCLPTQDLVNEVARRYRGRVNFLSIDVRDDPQDVRSTVAAHHWSIPVGYDRDGAVSNLYRVSGCPSVDFVYPGGILAFQRQTVSELSKDELDADVRKLLTDSRRRARRIAHA
jgi:thiol-disulfide isomerase/thioredoxin